MDRIEVLRAELSGDPLGIGYASMNAADVVAALNAKDKIMIVDHYATARAVLSVLGAGRGAAFLDALEAAAQSNRAVYWGMQFLTAEPGLNVGDPETRKMLDALAAGGVLNVADVGVVKAMAEKTVSRAEQLGLGTVTVGEVEAARAA